MKTYGYTLIELIVVVGVIVVLATVGIAGYNTFNQSQTLEQAALNVENALRTAQNKALAGEKLCKDVLGNNICQVDPGCGDNNDRVLDDWSIIITNNTTYNLRISCGLGAGLYTLKTSTLPTNMQFTTSPQTISFKPLGQRSTAASTIRIKHTGFSPLNCFDIIISVTGEIRRNNISC